MTTINRVRVGWTGWPGAPGVTTLHLDGSTTNLAPIKTFFTAIKNFFPVGTTWDIPAAGEQLDVGSNAITGVYTGVGFGQVVSTATSAAYTGGSGAVVRWITGAYVDGRKLQGKSYLVPLLPMNYATDGTLDSVQLAAIQTAANAMVTSYSGSFLIYHRPRSSSGIDPGTAGVTGAVLSAVVTDMAAQLKSRRK